MPTEDNMQSLRNDMDSQTIHNIERNHHDDAVIIRHDERIKNLEINWNSVKKLIELQTQELSRLSSFQIGNESKLLEMFKQVNATQERMSKDLWGNGRKGLIENFALLSERTEDRKVTHDKDIHDLKESQCKDIKRIDNVLWFVGTTSILSMLAIIGFFGSMFITNLYENKNKTTKDVVNFELKTK